MDGVKGVRYETATEIGGDDRTSKYRKYICILAAGLGRLNKKFRWNGARVHSFDPMKWQIFSKNVEVVCVRSFGGHRGRARTHF